MRQALWSILMTGALVCAPVVVSAPPALAQPSPQQVPYRILDPDRLLQGSLLGQQILARNSAAERALTEENSAIAEQLIVEERALTDLRPSLSPEEFRARADAFDARVEDIRAERSQRGVDLASQAEASIQDFFDTALPILDRLMADAGVVGLIRPEMMVLWSDWLDITDVAIARLDAAFREQQATPTPDPDAPQPQP